MCSTSAPAAFFRSSQRRSSQRLRSELNILTQKRARLDQQNHTHQRDIRDLDNSVLRMHTDMTRLNQLVAKNTSLQETLANDNFNLENNVVSQLEVGRLEARITQCVVRRRRYSRTLSRARGRSCCGSERSR